ncbi:hypothetical protein ADK98_34580 [Streptomyces sp. H036]|nr:hypothetical protein ADK98_34580 [Streptomyces sp. H036]
MCGPASPAASTSSHRARISPYSSRSVGTAQESAQEPAREPAPPVPASAVALRTARAYDALTDGPVADGDSTVGTAVSQCGRATPVNSLRGTPARGEGGAVRSGESTPWPSESMTGSRAAPRLVLRTPRRSGGRGPRAAEAHVLP